MANNIISINDYYPTGDDTFLFDNNVWIYLYCPLSAYDRKHQKIYSSFYQKILSSNSLVFVTSLILAEFVNRCLRFDYNQWCKNPINIQNGKDFKRDFVGSEAYKDSVENITINVNKILKLTEKYPDDFNAVDMSSILENLKSIDFNDAYFIHLAENRKLKIVTHDADFFNPKYKITVITGNRNY